MVLSLLTDFELADEFEVELHSRKSTTRSQPSRSGSRYNTQRRYRKGRANSTRTGMNRRANKFANC